MKGFIVGGLVVGVIAYLYSRGSCPSSESGLGAFTARVADGASSVTHTLQKLVGADCGCGCGGAGGCGDDSHEPPAAPQQIVLTGMQ